MKPVSGQQTDVEITPKTNHLAMFLAEMTTRPGAFVLSGAGFRAPNSNDSAQKGDCSEDEKFYGEFLPTYKALGQAAVSCVNVDREGDILTKPPLDADGSYQQSVQETKAPNIFRMLLILVSFFRMDRWIWKADLEAFQRAESVARKLPEVRFSRPAFAMREGAMIKF